MEKERRDNAIVWDICTFIVICMNNRHRVEGDNERAGRMQAGRRRDGRMARERGGEGGANA